MSRKTQVILDIELDENHIPETITWHAQDGGISNEPTKSVLISVWDDQKMEALSLDLWTKEMPVDHMKRFMHQIFIAMSHTYQKATNEDDVAGFIEEFAEEFARRSKIKF
jgi:gliding motility-associated protein GldC